MNKTAVAISLAIMMSSSLSGCSFFTEKQYSGRVVESRNVDMIQAGKSTKADVYDVLGSPSSKGSFERNIWYYVGDQRTRTAFMDPKVKNRQVIVVHFDKNDKVKKVERKTLNDGQDVKIQDSATPSYGTKKSVLEEMFGHVGISPLPQSGNGFEQ